MAGYDLRFGRREAEAEAIPSWSSLLRSRHRHKEILYKFLRGYYYYVTSSERENDSVCPPPHYILNWIFHLSPDSKKRQKTNDSVRLML
jgi:hypothetical protein